MNNPYNVQVGQLWSDNDLRVKRTLRIDKVDIRYAYVHCLETKTNTRIMLNRFNKNRSTGYTLIEDANI